MLSEEQCLGPTLISEDKVYQQFKSVQHVMRDNRVLFSCCSQQTWPNTCFSFCFLIYQHSSSVSDVFGG